MPAKLSILFLSLCVLFESGCSQIKKFPDSKDCGNKKFQDSLIIRYVNNGAEKLPYIYNNPFWDIYLDSIIAICPQIAASYELKAIPALKNGDYIKAFSLNEKAAELDSSQYVPYLGFLKCIFTKDYKAAITEFNRANKIVPGGGEMDHTFYFYLGICYMQLGKYKEAEANFNKDIFFQSKRSGSKDVHFNSLLYMGITKLEDNQLDSAKIYLNLCLNNYKELPEANYYMALIYKNRKELLLAKKYLEKARKSILDGYTMNEDNLFYVNYPRQITLYEVNQQLLLVNK